MELEAEVLERVGAYDDNDEPGAREWWSHELGLRIDDFTKSFVKPDGTGHRKNHLPNGVCILTKRKSANAYHITMAWIEFLQTTFGNYDSFGPLAQLARASDS